VTEHTLGRSIAAVGQSALDGLRSSPLTVGEQATAARLKRHALVCNQKLAGTKVPPLRPVFFNSGGSTSPSDLFFSWRTSRLAHKRKEWKSCTFLRIMEYAVSFPVSDISCLLSYTSKICLVELPITYSLYPNLFGVVLVPWIGNKRVWKMIGA
jgi:hypothetical protein